MLNGRHVDILRRQEAEAFVCPIWMTRYHIGYDVSCLNKHCGYEDNELAITCPLVYAYAVSIVTKEGPIIIL